MASEESQSDQMAKPMTACLYFPLCSTFLFFIFSISITTLLPIPARADEFSSGTIIHDDRNLSKKPRRSKSTPPLFVFGDSLYDPGNNNYINTTPDFQANFLPYGETFFEFATGRFSDGLLIPDFIAKYAGLPLIPPYFQSSYHQFSYGVNFASGGGGALVETHQGKAIDLQKQLLYFKDVEKQLRKNVGDKETQNLLSNAVYMFSIGGNDLIAPNPIFSSLSSQDYIQIIIGNFTSVLKEVYKTGGRKFGLLSLLPVGCLPYIRVQNGGGSGGEEICVEEYTKLVNQYNEAFSEEINQLEKQLPGFIYSKFDCFNAILERLQNPTNYGFKDVKSACCGSGIYRANYTCGGKRGDWEYELCDNPRGHFFFDSYHPSETVYNQLAELMWDGHPKYTGPYTLKALFQLGSWTSAHISQEGNQLFQYCEGIRATPIHAPVLP